MQEVCSGADKMLQTPNVINIGVMKSGEHNGKCSTSKT